jgi:hypothetical protein
LSRLTPAATFIKFSACFFTKKVFIGGMTIWILALVLLASAAGLGYRQGAIRAAFSFAGIVFAGLLAAAIGKILKPLLPHVGIHNPALVWMIAPIEGFVLVLIIFKVAGFFTHRKVEMYYKYKAGDLRLSLWERLIKRLGACVGLMNGAAYFILLCFVIFNFSYWTVQIASSDQASRMTRLVNLLGRDLQSTGMSKAAKSVATLPENYYKMADLAGLIFQNPQVGARLADYPPFLSLLERDDLQQLAHDAEFTNGWAQHAPMGQLLNSPQAKAALQNIVLIDTVLGIVQTNLDDLVTYLKTGLSPKYDSEIILGRWTFNPATTVAMVAQSRPNIQSAEMRAIRAQMTQAYAQTVFIAGADNQAFLKNVPRFKAGTPPTTENVTWKGQWSNDGTNYDLTLVANGENKFMTAATGGSKLMLKDDKITLVFDHE